MNFQVRTAVPSDARQLAHIQVDSYRNAYRTLLPAEYLSVFTYEEQLEDWQAILPVPTGSVLIVAEIQSEIAGYAYGQQVGYRDYDCELVALHVRESYQRRGIGRCLMRAVAQTFANMGCRALFLWTLAENPAIRLYTRLGGELIGTKPWGNNAYFDCEIQEMAIGWSDITCLLDQDSNSERLKVI